ncbi:MAG TPA: formate--tetrahydrofolate ligase [Thermotogota bacterium]|jgi:formate--tetrahydrofolate ligase|nr:formate--tetrahydrofolate ligase [Thermotogota bacterium]OQC30925.1 MAG: Formate--tetrahydrofolate ligase [Thermotogota bacterium ADurb.Bin062]HNW46664.1 formate--tetrahydrofolate ligase [Thermotogota bacterium]HNY82471.1 formate--tetrahydrofolate ligase [Thermotogota bacterium]HOD90971.1 formate--tetrahydrofolate ligase [Thermotogota bacterium]
MAENPNPKPRYPIQTIIDKLGIKAPCYHYGDTIAKIPYTLSEQRPAKRGKLVLVTAITPTAAGEGKTTTVIGLGQAMNRLNKKAIVTLREPSLGPVFGLKGGATGGGLSQVLPMEEINLHFTGDIHAVTTAHNLLSAMIDAHIHFNNETELLPGSIYWPRVMDMNDRSLRQIIVGLGGSGNGIPREDSFRITVASEVMAILCLSKSIQDLKERLGNITIGRNKDKRFVKAKELAAEGAMAALLKHALNPNIVQTTDGSPAIIHGGPFANIAHGTNSIVATNTSLNFGEYALVESGFAADLGGEKFLDFVTKVGDFWPDTVVLVASVRALKLHGGASKKELDQEDLPAVQKGIENLKVHLTNLRKFRVPVVVALNHFYKDHPSEINWVMEECAKMGAEIALSDVYGKGAEGGLDLARKVVDLCERTPNPQRIYYWNEPIKTKIERVAKEIYHAGKINYTLDAEKKIRVFSKEFESLPIIIAKTQYSISDDPEKLNAPSGYEFTVKDLSLSTGAGFIVVYAGDIMVMPGLPAVPAATKIDVNENGEITGLF